MAFRDFTFPEVQQVLGLSVTDADLFGGAPAVTLREEFANLIREGADLALAINTEKARSEFVIAQVLLELRRNLKGGFGLFSGVELNVDARRGLNGYCDFILTRSPRQFIVTTPMVAIVEAKNDNVHNGLGQCIAIMVAAQEKNQASGTPIDAVFGAVTTASIWRFLRLQGTDVTVDIHEYYLDNLPKIMGILTEIMTRR